MREGYTRNAFSYLRCIHCGLAVWMGKIRENGQLQLEVFAVPVQRRGAYCSRCERYYKLDEVKVSESGRLLCPEHRRLLRLWPRSAYKPERRYA